MSRQKNQSQLWIPRKPRKIGVWVSGAEIQTSAVDTRTAVWVSTPEKFSKIVPGKTRNFSRKFRGVSAPALDKNPAVIVPGTNPVKSPKQTRSSQGQPDKRVYVYVPFSGQAKPRSCKPRSWKFCSALQEVTFPWILLPERPSSLT